MTVQNTIVKNVYVGNGSTTVFPFTFECNKAEHIQAFVKDAAGNITSTTNFKVDLEQKNLTYPNTGEPLANGDKLIILRQLPLQQLLNLLNQGPFYAEDIEETFDEVVMMLQQMTEHIGRSLAVSVDIDSENSFNTIIPLEAGKTFRVKDDGTGFEVTEDPGKVIDGAKALLKLTTEQAEFAKEQADASSQSAVSAQNAATSVQKYKALWFDSVAAMKAEPSLTAGAYVCTAGYYESNDGGGASYLIRAKSDTDIDDGGSLHELVNGLVAELIIENGTINVKQFGAKGDNKTDDSNAIRQAIICAISRNGNERNLNCEVHFSEGIYCVKKDKLFSDFNFSEIGLGFQTVDGINFRGNGRTSSVIRLITKNESDTYTEKWLYNNESIDTQKFQKINFFNLGFDTDNYDYGNGFKQYSQGGEKQFRFYFCDIALGNVLWCEGAGNADLNRFISCGITAYKDLLTLNNTQSVSHMFVGTDMNIKRNLITVLSQGGGDVSISDCNIEMHELNDTDDIVDEEAYYLVNNPQQAILSNGNCHYVFSNIRFEMHGTKKCLVKTVNGNFPVDVCFNDCWWGVVDSPLRSVVEIYPSKSITFRNCTLHDNFQFTVNGKYSNSGAASCAGTIIFDGCNVGFNKMLADRIIINESDCYRVKATKCYKLASTSENHPIAQDFDYGWETKGAASVVPSKKIVAIKMSGDAWAIPSSASYDRIIELPVNAYITKIYLYRPAIVSVSASYQLHIGDYDKTKELASSKLATFNDIHKIDVTDVGKIDFNKLRVWATGDGGTPFTGGYGYIEYI